MTRNYLTHLQIIPKIDLLHKSNTFTLSPVHSKLVITHNTTKQLVWKNRHLFFRRVARRVKDADMSGFVLKYNLLVHVFNILNVFPLRSSTKLPEATDSWLNEGIVMEKRRK